MRTHRVDTNPIFERLLVAPAFNGIIVACREEQVLIWVPFYFFDIALMATQHAHAAVFVFIFLFVDPDGFVSAASSYIV